MTKINTDPKLIEEILTRGVEHVIVKEEIEKKLSSGKQLRVKHGVDPTTSDLHLGYAVPYLRLRRLQEMGHQIIFLIGSFTARFGDPSDKIETRKMRDKKEVENLAKDYIEQVSKVLDIHSLEIRYNGEWYDKMSAEELLHIMSEFTTARMLERDMFQERIKQGKKIGLHEIVYPVLQGYDSVILESDLTVIGNDQFFNELQARPLQEANKQEPQGVIAMELLEGTDGIQKMSQSLGNYIGFNETAEIQFGKIMSIPDNLIIRYFKLATLVSIERIQEIENEFKNPKCNPRDIKMELARTIVGFFHSDKKAKEAEEEFVRVIQNKETPTDMEEVHIKKNHVSALELFMLSGLVTSKGEAKRLILQRGIKVDEEIVESETQEFTVPKEGLILQKGKRHFVRVRV